jgi:hypothetical protein
LSATTAEILSQLVTHCDEEEDVQHQMLNVETPSERQHATLATPISTVC